MTSPTGNRWVNQDTGELANKDNVQTDLPGNPAKIKYGPSVTGAGEPPAELPVGAELPGAAQEAEHEALVNVMVNEGRKLGPLDQGQSVQNAELEQAKLDIRNYRRVAVDPKSAKDAQAAAKARLGQIAAAEYAREDGGRGPVKAALARAGFANPNKGA